MAPQKYCQKTKNLTCLHDITLLYFGPFFLKMTSQKSSNSGFENLVLILQFE